MPVMPIHTGASTGRPAGKLPRTHQSHNTEIGIQAGCCVYVSITYSNVEPDAPMCASYRA